MSSKSNPAQEPRLAAAVILLRPSGKHKTRGLEILLAKRSPSNRIMPGIWVFPGGRVELEDELQRDGDHGLFAKVAARELQEEVEIGVTRSQLLPWSRWITPTEFKIRYDVRFFVALAPAHTPPQPDGQEIVEAAWFRPKEALEQHSQGELEMIFPTVKHLEELATFESSDQVLETAQNGRSMEPIRPKVVRGHPVIPENPK